MGQIWSGERHVTTEALNVRVARAASGLASLGVGPGDTVALYLRNDISFLEAHFATGRLGAYPVPVNWHYAQDEAAYLLTDSQAKVIVIHADLYAPIKNVIPPGLPVLVVPTPPELQSAYGVNPPDGAVPAGLPNWHDWVDGFESWEAPPVPTPSSMIYTSGTTGRPKGVRRAPPTAAQAGTFLNIVLREFGLLPYMADPAGIVTVVTGPMYHSAPNAYGTRSVFAGATVYLQPKFDPEDMLRMIEAHNVTHLHMVPVMFNRLLRLPDAVRGKYDLSSLRFVVHAAAPCPEPVKRAMIEWWGPIIHEYYGCTESSMIVSCNSEEWLSHPGTVGRPIPEATLKIIGENGEALPPHGIGEILCRLNGVADFTYHGNDQKRQEAEKSGLLAPGDIGYVDTDGFLYICDRAKDMIISGGVNIYPAEIEVELHKISGIADCAVFGIPDQEYGEAVCAAVQLTPGTVLSEAEVRNSLRMRMANFKVPKKIVFETELPREDSGKIFKRKLREPYWAELGRRI
jgi:long-chain acyl-CoA synthetase